MSAAGNAKHQAALAATADLVDQLRGDIRDQLTEIVKLDDYLAGLAHTRQSVGPGFLTADARALADKQTRADRAAARTQPARHTPGLAWLNADYLFAGTQTPAPVTISATSASAEVATVLTHHVRRLAVVAVRAAAAAVPGSHGRLPIDLPTTDPDQGVLGLAAQLADLVDVCTSRPRLQALLRDLEHTTARASDVVDGPARANHPDPCPWCGQQTLVVHNRRPGSPTPARIRCEGHHRCECDYEDCACHRNPIRHRHEWTNSGRVAHTWSQLANLQAARRELARMETLALDAAARAINLHQPAWLNPDDTITELFVHVSGDQVPADHQCPTGSPVTTPEAAEEAAAAGRAYCQTVTDGTDTHTWHAIPVCATCGDAGQSGDPANAVPWPCPTHHELDPDTWTQGA